MNAATSLALSTRPARASTNFHTAAAKKKTKPNLYKLLSLDESVNVGPDDIKKAYKRMALKHHPDAAPASQREESTRMFVELHRAYETLSDPVLRRRYDSELGRGRSDVFPREVWEAQLRELERRSERRQQRERAKGRDHMDEYVDT